MLMIANGLLDHFCCHLVAYRTGKIPILSEFSAPLVLLKLGKLLQQRIR